MNFLNHLIAYVRADAPLANMRAYAERESPYFVARTLVQAYYAFLLFISIGMFSRWDFAFGAQAGIEYPWSVSWLSVVGYGEGYTIIRILFIATSLLAVCMPRSRIARTLSFISLFEFVSLFIAILQLDVDGYGLILTSFMFIFLPSARAAEDLKTRARFLAVFWGALALNLLTYTMGGIGKLWGAIEQIGNGASHFFSPHAAALHIADRLILTDATSLLGPWAVNHPYLIWPYFLFTFYILSMSFFVAFRPNLHRLWGLLLILYHTGNYLTVNIGFVTHLFLWSILLLASPFAPARTSLRGIITSLPLVDLILRAVRRKSISPTASNES